MSAKQTQYHPDSVFLTDGITIIRYRNLSYIRTRAVEYLHHLLSSMPSHDQAGTETASAFESIGIDTTDRFQAALWMTCCWLDRIPFILFDTDYIEPLYRFKPGYVVRTSKKTLRIPSYSGDIKGTDSIAPDLAVSNNEPDPNMARFTEVFTGLRHHPEEVFCGLLTSGSAGEAKKVPLLRKQMIAAANNTYISNDTSQLWGNSLPLYHTGGLAIIFRALLGGKGVYIWNWFDAGTILDDLHAHSEIGYISLVPTMLKRLMDISQTSGKPIPGSLRKVLVGGGPAPSGLLETARNAGWPVIFSYGMTETCGQVAAQQQDGSSPVGSVGTLFSGHELTIRYENGQKVPALSSGVLWLRGPQVFPGYLTADTPLRRLLKPKTNELDRSSFFEDSTSGNNRPPSEYEINTRWKNNIRLHSRSKPVAHEGTRNKAEFPIQTVSESWFQTGDYARLDNKGNLFIEARRTDLILSGGKNIRPVEIESVLLSLPEIKDVAVTGVPDQVWGQKMVALVVMSSKNPEKLTIESGDHILAELSDRLMGYQKPKAIYFVDAIPRTPLGKIRRDDVLVMATNLHDEK
ncbi:MAG: AMP-binding protein [Balneolales bacterium]